MFGRPGAWESLKVKWMRDTGDTGDNAIYSCSMPDGLTVYVIIPGTAKASPNRDQKIREWFKYYPQLLKTGTPPTPIPGSHFSSF